MSRACKIVLINVLAFVLLLEGSLQVIAAIGYGNTNPAVKRLYSYIKPSLSWEEWFLSGYMDKGNMVYAGIHSHHPTRGWAMRPSAHFQAKPRVHYTTNAQGYRALHDFRDEPEKFQMIFLGDSFTFGDEIDDVETWPGLLEGKSAEFNVFNMGGTGYGTDQMLITLEEEISRYHPDLVVAAYTDDNLNRSLLPFRDYKKPLFSLSDGKLSLTNVPIGTPAEVMTEIASRRYFSISKIQLINLLNYFVSELHPLGGSTECAGQCYRLNEAIFDRMRDVASSHGAEFMLIYLPHGKEIKSMDEPSYGQAFFETYRSNRPGYYFNPRPQLVAADFPKAQEHYRRNENNLLAQLVFDEILKMESWQCRSGKSC